MDSAFCTLYVLIGLGRLGEVGPAQARLVPFSGQTPSSRSHFLRLARPRVSSRPRTPRIGTNPLEVDGAAFAAASAGLARGEETGDAP